MACKPLVESPLTTENGCIKLMVGSVKHFTSHLIQIETHLFFFVIIDYIFLKNS